MARRPSSCGSEPEKRDITKTCATRIRGQTHKKKPDQTGRAFKTTTSRCYISRSSSQTRPGEKEPARKTDPQHHPNTHLSREVHHRPFPRSKRVGGPSGNFGSDAGTWPARDDPNPSLQHQPARCPDRRGKWRWAKLRRRVHPISCLKRQRRELFSPPIHPSRPHPLEVCSLRKGQFRPGISGLSQGIFNRNKLCSEAVFRQHEMIRDPRAPLFIRCQGG